MQRLQKLLPPQHRRKILCLGPLDAPAETARIELTKAFHLVCRNGLFMVFSKLAAHQYCRTRAGTVIAVGPLLLSGRVECNTSRATSGAVPMRLYGSVRPALVAARLWLPSAAPSYGRGRRGRRCYWTSIR